MKHVDTPSFTRKSIDVMLQMEHVQRFIPKRVNVYECGVADGTRAEIVYTIEVMQMHPCRVADGRRSEIVHVCDVAEGTRLGTMPKRAHANVYINQNL